MHPIHGDAVIGLQWGDEGKGKIVYHLSKQYDWIVRFCGGSNAGHTIYHDGQKIVHHQIPSSDPSGQTKMLMASGVALDFWELSQESEQMPRPLHEWIDKLYIDALAILVLPVHKMLDKKKETQRGAQKIGTTGKGIGPAYTDRVSRVAIRAGDLKDPDRLLHKLELLADFHDPEQIEPKTLRNELLDIASPYITRIISVLEIADQLRKESVLFEGAQAALLDVDIGTYPYVTSSITGTSGIPYGLGMGKVTIDKVYGVAKAYLTRVGEGPFPTEAFGLSADWLREKGQEYGATTGRPRRCGWIDLPLLRYAIMRCGVDGLILTKPDVLCGLKEISVCSAYRVNEQELRWPADLLDIDHMDPVYRSLEGWENLDAPEFQDFVQILQEETDTPVSMISTGPQTDQIIEGPGNTGERAE